MWSDVISIVYKSEPQRGEHWRARFAEQEPSLPFHIWPEVGDPAAVEYLVAWQPPADLSCFPQLRVIFSIGAGVDQFDLSSLPPQVKLVRMLDPGITQGMVEYATLAVLALHRDLPRYLEAQRAARWQALPGLSAQRRRVGIMGLGNLGRAVCSQLQHLGFPVSGWSRSRHSLPGLTCFAGTGELPQFLSQVDILVCLLPLTEETRGILCADTFASLPEGACLVCAGRGGHLREQDLLDALASGQLQAAVVDVLEPEPPASEHPFWQHPRILLTPHIAATTQADSGGDVLLENIRLERAGLPIPGEVDRGAGY